MLSHKILTRQDINRAASYYEDSADDYYAKDGKASEWQGEGAKILGLSGVVDSTRFRQLMSGEVELTKNTRSATRQDSNQRIGIDLTFSAPKSVSIQALIANDEKIIKAHDKAVQRTIKIAEQRAEARKKIKGKSQVELTKNLIVARFRHETSRERDPQLHTHAIVMNLTQRSDGQWRALRNDEIIKMTRYLGSVYHAELALELQKIGYVLRHERDGLFELDHISREQIEGFSKRSMQILQRLEKQGLSRKTATTKQKQQATMQSRKHKMSVEREIIFKGWQTKAEELGINFDGHNGIKQEKSKIKIKKQNPLNKFAKTEAAKRALRFAINHLTERQSVMTERVLLNTAMKQVVGAASLADIERQLRTQVKQGYLRREDSLYVPVDQINTNQGKIKQEWINELISKGMNKNKASSYVKNAIKQGSLIKLEPRYTTETVLKREHYILQSELKGRSKLVPILTAEIVELKLASSDLNKGQLEAAKLMATTKNRIVGIQGFAGTGKSHMLSAAKRIIESEGYRIRALAPYGGQVKALRELGVKANTLASFLRSKDKDLDDRTVVVIDEAGVVPTRLMEQTIKLVEKTGARIVLIGDTAQTKAIEAGKPFDQLQSAGMETAFMDQIQRQKNKILKEAVELAAQGLLESSLKSITDIIEIKDDKERQSTIAKDYIKLPIAERNGTIIVSGTNEARHNINHLIREGLDLTNHGLKVDVLLRRDATKAEAKFSKYYYIGDIIQPEKDYPRIGLKCNELYRVEDTGPGNRLTVSNEAGEQFQFNPMIYQKFSTYQLKNIELSADDLVRITRNDAKLDIVNGDRFKVQEVQVDHILLTDGERKIKFATDKPLYIDYAYATTVHSSQGLTNDKVLFDADTKSLTTAKDTYYVGISRARKEVRMYTNNSKDLLKAISRENTKPAALDILKYKEPHKQSKISKRGEKNKDRELDRGN